MKAERDYDSEFNDIIIGVVSKDEKFRRNSDRGARKLASNKPYLRTLVLPLVLIVLLMVVAFAVVPVGYPQVLTMVALTCAAGWVLGKELFTKRSAI